MDLQAVAAADASTNGNGSGTGTGTGTVRETDGKDAVPETAGTAKEPGTGAADHLRIGESKTASTGGTLQLAGTATTATGEVSPLHVCNR